MKPQTVFVLVGPSGVGKSSILDKAVADYSVLCDIITYTTRAMRPGERQGAPYHFVDRNRFQELIQAGAFVEWAEVHGQYYGTPWDQIREAWGRDQAIIMDVDVQGAQTLKRQFPQAVSIFLLPPSKDSLRQRLEKRGGTKDIELRLKTADRELSLANQFDYQIVNDDFSRAYREFQNIVEKVIKNR